MLGFYLSSHPLAEHQQTFAAYCSHTTTQAAELGHRTEAMLGGMISAIKLSNTKNPKPGSPSRFAMFDLEDTDGIMRCIVWPEQFAHYEHLIQADAIVVVRGAVDKRPGSEEANFIVNEVIPLEDLPSRYTRGVRIRISETEHGAEKLEQLYEILRGYPGNCSLELYDRSGRRHERGLQVRPRAGGRQQRDAIARGPTSRARQLPPADGPAGERTSGPRQRPLAPLRGCDCLRLIGYVKPPRELTLALRARGRPRKRPSEAG